MQNPVDLAELANRPADQISFDEAHQAADQIREREGVRYIENLSFDEQQGRWFAYARARGRETELDGRYSLARIIHETAPVLSNPSKPIRVDDLPEQQRAGTRRKVRYLGLDPNPVRVEVNTSYLGSLLQRFSNADRDHPIVSSNLHEAIEPLLTGRFQHCRFDGVRFFHGDVSRYGGVRVFCDKKLRDDIMDAVEDALAAAVEEIRAPVDVHGEYSSSRSSRALK